MTDTTRDLIRRLVEKLDLLHCQYNVPNQSALIDEAHAYLDQLEPKPPSLKESALNALEHILRHSQTDHGANTIRRALEALPDD